MISRFRWYEVVEFKEPSGFQKGLWKVMGIGEGSESEREYMLSSINNPSFGALAKSSDLRKIR